MTLRQLLLLGALAVSAPALGQLTLPSPSEPSAPPKTPAGKPVDTPRPSPTSAEFDLRPKFTKGSIVRLRMETSSENESFMPGLSLDPLDKPAGRPPNKQITSKPKVAPGKATKPA
ncbi:MAG: hypothetical protein AABZ53_08435, partial [Planctomycetota bacterium]